MNKNNFDIYLDSNSRHQAYKNLIINSYEIFKSAFIIQNISEIENYAIKIQNKDTIESDFDTYNIFPLTLLHLIDMVKICLFFKNYMKATLIYKGFIVHLISRKWQKELAKEQENRPIRFDELYNKENFIMDENENVSHNSLLEQTIKFSNILNKRDYKLAINLPLNIISTLNEINLKRNELHLHREVELSLSLQYVQNVKELNRFADSLFNKNISSNL